MRAALAARDIAAVFRLLQRVGVSQRRIAALTGQSQSEISEILAGRQVVSYDVLTRIADGLGVARGSSGWPTTTPPRRWWGSHRRPWMTRRRKTRATLARLTELTIGAATVDPQTWNQPFALSWGPTPERVGLADVARLAAITEQLRALDREHGGEPAARRRWPNSPGLNSCCGPRRTTKPPRHCTVPSATFTCSPAGPPSTWAFLARRGDTSRAPSSTRGSSMSPRWWRRCSTAWVGCTCTTAGRRKRFGCSSLDKSRRRSLGTARPWRSCTPTWRGRIASSAMAVRRWPASDGLAMSSAARSTTGVRHG